MPEHQAELVKNARATLGEGPLWDYRQGLLYWLDIQRGRLHIHDPAIGDDRHLELGQEVGCQVLRSAGGLVLAGRHGFFSLDRETQTTTSLLDPEHHLPDNRFNDGKCDPYGRFWAGTMNSRHESGAGSLYCLYPDLTIRTMVTGVSISNGLAWSPDHKIMYYIDTGSQEVWRFDYDLETAEIGGRQAAFSVPRDLGRPDGMTIDREGMLWVALWGGGAISRWDPAKGRLIEKVEVPAPHTSACAFGGLKMDTLYITTARSDLEKDVLKQYPKSGGLFCVEADVPGLPEPMFAG